ncbi:GNAT family N-acetyltransferase, partial [Candidatus Eisenbacteria bacterium]
TGRLFCCSRGGVDRRDTMVVQGERVLLRDRKETDVADFERWFAPGQAWQKWDGPWHSVDPDKLVKRLGKERQPMDPLPEPRTRFEIETLEGRHIGWVNSYWVDQHALWRDCGIVLAEADLWERGLGREAFRLWTDYLIREHDLPRLGMGTWSGNIRMIHVAASVGMFEEARFPDARLYDGRRWDAVRWGFTRAEWNGYQQTRGDGLRRYTPADRDRVVELVRQLYQHHHALQQAPEYTVQDAQETVLEWLRSRENVLYLWQRDGVVVALAHVRQTSVRFFEELVVCESCRGQGVGAQFMTAIEDELRAVGDNDVFLSMVWPGNPRAIDFYRRQGYDLINTFELRKGLNEDRRGRRIQFLKRRFHLGKSVPPL